MTPKHLEVRIFVCPLSESLGSPFHSQTKSTSGFVLLVVGAVARFSDLYFIIEKRGIACERSKSKQVIMAT